MPGSECSKLRKAMDTRLKSGRGRALEKQKMGQGGGFTERRGGNTGDRSPGEGTSNSLQYSCLETPIDGGAWCTMVHGVRKSWTGLKQLNRHRC